MGRRSAGGRGGGGGQMRIESLCKVGSGVT